MKRISLLLLLMACVSGIQAQRNIVLQCEVINPVYNQNIITGSMIDFEYKVTNISTNAADSLQIGDTVRLATPLSRFDGTNFKAFIMELVMVKTIPAGGEMLISSGTSIPFAHIETLGDPLDGNKFKSKPFIANKQYSWFCSIHQVSAPVDNIPIAGTSFFANTTLVWINKTTGINDVNMDAAMMKTYPNPAINQLFFDYFFKGKNAIAIILNASGRVVMTKELKNLNGPHKIDLDISVLPSGIYFLKLHTDDQSAIARFSIQK